jgi:hypothetical protein
MLSANADAPSVNGADPTTYELPPMQAAILEVLRGGRPMTAKALASKTGYAVSSRFNSELTALARAGMVVRVPDGWKITDPGTARPVPVAERQLEPDLAEFVRVVHSLLCLLPMPLRLTIEAPGNSVSLAFGEQQEESTDASAPALSPLEASIVRAIGTSALKGQTVARRVGESYGPRLKIVLSNLVERGVLRTSPEGYQVVQTGLAARILRSEPPAPPKVAAPCDLIPGPSTNGHAPKKAEPEVVSVKRQPVSRLPGLDPVEGHIISTLAKDELPAEVIAERCGFRATQQFKGILSGLVKRAVLAEVAGGYRVVQGPSES